MHQFLSRFKLSYLEIRNSNSSYTVAQDKTDYRDTHQFDFAGEMTYYLSIWKM